MSFLGKSLFKNYSPIGTIYVKNSLVFMSYVDSFADEVKLEKINDYSMKLSDPLKDIFVILGSELVCDNKLSKELTFELPFSFNTNSTYLKTLNKDAILFKTKNVIFENKENVLTVRLGDEESDYVIKKIDSGIDTVVRSKFGEMIVKITSILDGNITISLGNETPIVVEEVTKDRRFKFVVANMIESE